MTKKKTSSQPEVVPVPNVNFYFNKGKKPEIPKNFKELKIGQKVTVIVTGKTESIRQDEFGESFGLNIDNVDIKIPKGMKSMSDTMEDIKTSRVL